MGALYGLTDLDRILALAKHFPVFPCNDKKRPLVPGGFHAATKDPAQIRAWWREWPEALVGVPTGQTTGLVVIDYDPAKATSATHAWIAERTALLTSTRVHDTRSSGKHYLFRSTSRYQTGTDLILDGSPRRGIDLRANGGYVVWWPCHGGRVTGEELAALPAGLIDERLFRPERDMAPLPAAPELWHVEAPKVSAALPFISPEGYEQWIRVGMAIHAASGGSDAGFALWHEWSATGESYDGIEDCRYHWASFGRYDGRQIGLGSLFQIARANGYGKPDPADFMPPSLEAPDTERPPDEVTVTSEKPAITVTPVTAELLTGIPPRQFLYRHHYLRKFVSATAATGGTGKTAVQMVEAISMALGIDLLHPHRPPLACGPLTVWIHNGEDPLEEIRRRIAAVLKHYDITADDLEGRLLVTSGREHQIIMARDIQGTTIAVPETREAVKAVIRQRRVDCLILDPFISTHQVNENSNPAIEVVTYEWRSIAEENNLAIDFTHHFRKGGQGEPGADDIRGASSLMGAVRSARVLAPMTKEEADNAKIDPADRRRYLYEVNAKANLTPATDQRHWYYLESVGLDNAEPPYPADSVGVAVRWEYPSLHSTLTPPMQTQALAALRNAEPMNRRKPANSTGWAGIIVAQSLEIDLSAEANARREISQLLARWEQQGKLRIVQVYDPRQARKVPVYEVVDA